MSTELAAKPKSLKNIIKSPAMQEQFAAALPKHLTAERFGRVAITALTRNPKLQDCTQESFFKCLLDLSAMGLEPDGRRAHLIPYKRECTLVLDYKGLVELARRSGMVSKIHADVVCDNDTFRHSMGEVTEHTYDLKAERGEPYAAYSQVTFKDGSVQAVVLSKAEIDAVRKRSRAGSSGPWVTDWAEMAKKTAFRRLSKWLTLSPEVSDALDRSERSEFGERAIERTTDNPFSKPIETEDKPIDIEAESETTMRTNENEAD
jgi:recombination protein RecT